MRAQRGVLLALAIFIAFLVGFKAIFVPSGRHTVRLEHRPTAIIAHGLLFMAIGFAGVTLGVWALASPPRLPRFGRRA